MLRTKEYFFYLAFFLNTKVTCMNKSVLLENIKQKDFNENSENVSLS